MFYHQLRKLNYLLLLLFVSVAVFGQDSLIIHYQNRTPYAYAENATVRGIEVDIMNEYMLWLATKKKKSVGFRYVKHNDQASVIAAMKSGNPNHFGLISVTPSAELSREVDFTVPYLKHVAFCVSNGNAPEIKNKTKDDVVRALGAMTAITVTNTSLNYYVNDLKKAYINDLKVVAKPDDYLIMSEISKNVLFFGYVDAVHFQYFLKMNPTKVLKIQKPLTVSKDPFAFVLPKNSNHRLLFNEFFNAFKTTPAYKAILEKHLGAYMAGNVSL